MPKCLSPVSVVCLCSLFTLVAAVLMSVTVSLSLNDLLRTIWLYLCVYMTRRAHNTDGQLEQTHIVFTFCFCPCGKLSVVLVAELLML